MRIALVVSDDLSALLFCKGIIGALISIPGAEIHVVCEITQHRAELEQLGGIPVDIGAYRFFGPLADLRYAMRLRKYFRDKKMDVVVNFATKQNVFGTIAGKAAGVPRIYSHVVGRGNAFDERKDFRGWLLRRGVSLLYRLVGRWSQKVWFTNESDLRYFRESGLVREEKAILTRNYLDPAEYSPDLISSDRLEAARAACRLGAGERAVVMVARMNWAKGVREFAEAAALLRADRPELKFVLVAPLEEGSYGAVPADYARDMEQKANFVWLGFQRDVKAFYAISQLAVLPSYYKEGGYPRALLEPMAMGKPIITTDTDGCRGTVENGLNGLLVPPRDPNALAESVRRIMDDDDLRERMGRYSQLKSIRDFSESNIVPGALRRMGLPVPESA